MQKIGNADNNFFSDLGCLLNINCKDEKCLRPKVLPFFYAIIHLNGLAEWYAYFVMERLVCSNE